MLVELNDENFCDKTSKGLRFVEFYTPWCSYCNKQQEVLEQLSDGGFWIGKINCDTFPDIAKNYGISAFPSFLLFRQGEIITQFCGYHTKSQLLDKLTSVL